MTGFSDWCAACLANGIVSLPPLPLAPVPPTVLGHALDPALREIYAVQNGGLWSSDRVMLRLYPLDGPDALIWRNESLRRAADDFVPPYRFNDLLVFGQFGRQASYLATIPALSDAAGRQPVVYLDTHEDVWAVPVAACVDAALALLAAWLAWPPDTSFPLEVPGLLAVDRDFAGRVRAGEFLHWCGENAEILVWIAACFKAETG